MIDSGGSDLDPIAPDLAPHTETSIGGLAVGYRGKGLMRGLVGLVILAAVVWVAILLLA